MRPIVLSSAPLLLALLGACRRAEAPRPLPPMKPIDIQGPREIVTHLQLTAIPGLEVISKLGTQLDDEWHVHARATDEAIAAVVERGCTAEHHCTVKPAAVPAP